MGRLTLLGSGYQPGGGGSGFTPGSLTGLIGWYKADTGVTTSSGNITAVTDQSGTGHNLINVGTVPYNATSAYNSHPAFDFAVANNAGLATGNNPSASSVTLASNLTNLSVFFVGRMNSASAPFARFVAVAGGADPDYNSGNNITFTRDSGTAALNAVYNSTAYASTSISADANLRFGYVMNGSTITPYVNGAAGTPAAFTTLNIGKTSDVFTNTNLVVGNQWSAGVGGGAGAWDGPILEVVIAISALSSTDAASLDAYFVARLGS